MKNNSFLNSQKNIWSIIAIGWLAILVMMYANHFDVFGLMLWVVVLPYTVLLVLFHFYYLIPFLPKKRFWSRRYFSNLIPTILVLGFIASLITDLIWQNQFEFIPMFFMLLLYSVFIAAPFSWYVYKNHYDKVFLFSQLGVSQANLGLLRSQINPHFLFNTLNSLYGTALQENAERTSEGIQKLGDMMRFMLYENTQDSISLSREINYLKNYIELQKLRIAKSPDILIEAEIDETFSDLQIAPMLLIPFVENAFKHGISFQEPSFIKINLQILENRLLFMVTNSAHSLKPILADEQKGGIGLENVKQRLSLLYSGKHELIIRENSKEYFAHLTLTL